MAADRGRRMPPWYGPRGKRAQRPGEADPAPGSRSCWRRWLRHCA